MFKLRRNNKIDIGIIVLSTVMYVALANAPFKAKPFGDYDFHVETKTIARVMWGEENFDRVSVTKAPGPVFFYLVPYLIIGPTASENSYWLAGIIWTGLFMTVSVVLLKKSCENFGSVTAGELAALLVFVLPLHIYYSLGILAEGLAFFGCCLQIYGISLLYKGVRTNYPLTIFSTGLLTMILARPNAMLALPILLIVFLWMAGVKKNQLFRELQRKFLLTWFSTCLVLAMVIVLVKLLPNTRRSVQQEGYLGFVATIGRYQFREEPWDWRFWDDNTRPDSKDYINWQIKLNEIKHSHASYSHFVLEDITHHPFNTIKQFSIRTLFGHFLQVSSIKKENFGIGTIKGKWVYWTFHVLLNAFNLFLIIAALSYLLSKKTPGLIKIITIPWMALVLFHGFVYMEQRYLFPIRPIIVVLSTLFITSHFFQKKGMGKQSEARAYDKT